MDGLTTYVRRWATRAPTKLAVIVAAGSSVLPGGVAYASTASVRDVDDVRKLVVAASTTDGANRIVITRSDTGELAITDTAGITPTQPECRADGPTRVLCDPMLLQAIGVTLGVGNDTFEIADDAYPGTPPPPGRAQLQVTGDSGEDQITAGTGINDLQGNEDVDLIVGGDAVDDVSGGEGGDTIQGRGGADYLSGSEGRDRIEGGAGSDELIGGKDDDTVFGGDDGDLLFGEEGDDRLYGEGGNDRLDVPRETDDKGTSSGADLLDGGSEDDLLDGGPTRDNQDPDTLIGGSGVDTADFSQRTSSLRIDLSGLADDGESGEHDDVEADVERVLGGFDNDTLNGSDGDNLLDGRDGDDRLNGRGGNDVLDGGANTSGSDRLNGGDGDDALVGRAGDDALNGEDGSDALSGSGGIDTLIGESGNDDLRGGAAGDTLSGGSGDDTLNGAEPDQIGADGDDRIFGGPGRDVVLGDEGDDLLDGGLGSDGIRGGPGRDTVTYEDRSSPVTVTLDGIADDGEAGELDNVGRDVEAVVGGNVGDSLYGDGDANGLDAGAGEDLLVGNLGSDRMTAGSGPDVVLARDGRDDVVSCGDDGDLAIVDRADTVRDCETLDRGGRRRVVAGRLALVRSAPAEFGLRLPDGQRYFPLGQAVTIPIGSALDPRDGEIRLVTARNGAGGRQEVRASGGRFDVRQSTGRAPTTELRLVGGRFGACPRSRAQRRVSSIPADAPVRQLVTAIDRRKRGPLRVRGRYSLGAAIGTTWLTEDRCNGTFTKVESGTVRVHDRARDRDILVHAGESYLARAG